MSLSGTGKLVSPFCWRMSHVSPLSTMPHTSRPDGVRKVAVELVAAGVGVGVGVGVAVGAGFVPGSPPAAYWIGVSACPQAARVRASRMRRTFMPRRLPDVQRHLSGTPTVAAGLK